MMVKTIHFYWKYYRFTRIYLKAEHLSFPRFCPSSKHVHDVIDTGGRMVETTGWNATVTRDVND